MNFRRLEQLVALAEEGSFVKAAERCHLSQPALTRGIQALERDLGVRLFDRTSRKVVLTRAGQQLVDRARRVLFEARGLQRDADLIRNHELGGVRFGAGSYPAAILLPDVLTLLTNDYPGLKVKVEVNDWATLLDKVLDERLDFAIIDRRTVPPDAHLTTRRLAVEAAGWYVRAGHPLAARASLTTPELRDYPLVSVPLPEPVKSRLQRKLRLAPGEALALSVECNDLLTLREVVTGSNAVLSATPSLCRQALAEGRLVRLNINDSHQSVEFAVTRLAQRTLSPAARQTLSLIEQVVHGA
jgi:DNA-binding transcriptional LysR family regulator